MRTSTSLLSLVLLFAAALPAHSYETTDPTVSQLQVLDCNGSYVINPISISTARTNIRTIVQDTGDGMSWIGAPFLSSGPSTNVLVLHMEEASGGPYVDSTTFKNNSTAGGGTTQDGAIRPNSLFGNTANFPTGVEAIRIPASSTITLANRFSMMAWIRPTSSNSMPIFEYDYNPGAGLHMWYGDPSPSNDQALYASVKKTSVAVDNTAKSLTNAIPTNQWSHVAFTYGSSVMRLYRNGVEIASRTIGNISPLATNSDLLIGSSPASGLGFVGNMDAVVVSSAVISAEEIAAYYHASFLEHTTSAGTNRILLSTGTNPYFTTGPDPGTPVDPANGLTALTTVTVTGLDFSTISANDITMIFRDVHGNTNGVSRQGILVDVRAPTPPTGLSGSPVATDQLQWSWNAPSRHCLLSVGPDVAGQYKVKQATDNAVVPAGGAISSLNFTETNLTTNTAYGRVATAFDAYGESLLSVSATHYTQAAPPINLVTANITTHSVQITWQANQNPNYTRYEVGWSSASSPTTSSPTVINDNFTALTQSISNLSVANTTYTIRVRAFNGQASDFSGDTFSSDASIVFPTLPASPTNLTVTVDGPTQLTWNWTSIPTAQSYTLQDAANNTLSNTSTLQFVQTSLTPNTLYSAKLRANNASGSGLFSTTSSIFTDANPPTGLTAVTVTTGAATFSWGANSNPANTNYRMTRSTDVNFAGDLTQQTVTTTGGSFIGLLQGTTYYVRVAAANLNGGFSTPTAGLKIVTNRLTPVSVSSAPQTPYSSEAGSVAIYHFDEGAGTVVMDSTTLSNDGTLRCTFVNCSSPTYTSGQAGLGTAVSFSGIQNTYCEVPDDASLNTNTALSLEAWVHPTTTLQIPQATIIAKGSGTYESFGMDIQSGKVRFFIRDTDAGPSPTMHTVVSTQNLLADRWTHLVGVYKPAPSATLNIYIDGQLSKSESITLAGSARLTNSHVMSIGSRKSGATNFDLGFQGYIDEVHVVTAELTASSAAASYQSGRISTMTIPSPNNKIRLLIPPNAFGGETTISVSSDPIGNPITAIAQTVIDGLASPPSGGTLVPDSLVEITPSQSGTPLPANYALASSITVSIDYPDADGNQLVDGTNPPLPVSLLKMYTLNATVGSWEELPSVVDTEAKRVVGLTGHFSVFALFGTTNIQLNTNSIKIFPVPWKPGSGGVFDSATFAGRTGLAFGNLTVDGSIRIFTLSGEHVVSLEYSGADQGTFIWDGKNNAGQKIASGVYFAYIKPNSGSSVVLKFAVER